MVSDLVYEWKNDPEKLIGAKAKEKQERKKMELIANTIREL